LTAEGISTRRQILRTLDDIYNAIAVALQREDVTRARKEDQGEVVRNALIRQRTLLIVDNLETVDDEAVMDFLRELPAPTKAIVTTRHRLDVAYPVRLTGMPWEDAQMLIQQECEKKGVMLADVSVRGEPVEPYISVRGEPVEPYISVRGEPVEPRMPFDKLRANGETSNARRLYDRTGGVPLAIVWSIAQMGFGYSVEVVLNRLGQPTNDISRFCFEGAVEQIRGKPAHKLLMVLSLCADSASRESLGYATELPELDRDDGLVALEKLSLVNKQGDRFSLLPLTKQYATAELEKSAERERLREQWIEYFRKMSEEYTSEYWNLRNHDWLLAEGENIMTIVKWAIAIGFGETALLFTRVVCGYLDIQGRWSELADYGEKFYIIAQTIDDKRTLAWICFHWLAWLYNNQEKMETAEILVSRSLSLYRELDDKKGMCLAMSYLGRILSKSTEREIDSKIFEQAMQLAEEIDYGDGKAAIHHELGKLARDRGHWEDAKTHWKITISWCEDHKDEADLDTSLLMGAIGNLGWVEFHLGNHLHGKELLERSLKFFESMGGKGYLATLHVRLATVEKALGNRGRALQHAQEAYFWAERLGMVRELEGAKALLDELNAKKTDKRDNSRNGA
jgi:tetratricopeptide (TPR) repeat protein